MEQCMEQCMEQHRKGTEMSNILDISLTSIIGCNNCID